MTKAEKELAVVAPKQLQHINVQKRGMENAHFDQSDFIIPRAKIVQALSKEATDGDLRPGTMVNAATGEVLAKPEEVFQVQVISVTVGQVYLEDKALKCFSADGITGVGDPGGSCVACPLSKWSTNDKGESEPPLCMKTYNYLSRFIDSAGGAEIPINLSLSKSSSKTARKINTTFRFYKGDIWDIALKLKTVKKTNDKGTFYVLEMVGTNPLDEAEISIGEGMYEFLQTANYTISQDTDSEEADDGERPDF